MGTIFLLLLCLTLCHSMDHSMPGFFVLSPGVYSNSCPLSRWCHPTIASCCPLLVLPPIFPQVKVFPNELTLHISSVQSLSRVWLFATPWTAAHQASLSITSSQSPPKPTSIESVMPSNHLILCRPLLLPPSTFPSIRVFSNESVLHMRWPKYWSFSFSICPSNEHTGLISFKMDWLDLLAVQGTLKSLLQHHSSKASILRGSAFFLVQLSHSYMTTGKTGGQKIGTSASASILPTNFQGWLPLGLTVLISLLSWGLWRVFSCTSLKTSILWHSAFFMMQFSHPYMTTGKTIALARWTFLGKVMSLLF